VFFFDEAHLLFKDAPKAFLDKVEQVVRLIRSKGVGVYFVTQNPMDVPEPVLGQLGNRVQHALRAFTPKDQKAVRAAAQTFRTNPKLDTATVITELGVGEALVSVLQDGGVPSIASLPTNCCANAPRKPTGRRKSAAQRKTQAHEKNQVGPDNPLAKLSSRVLPAPWAARSAINSCAESWAP